jgi:RimJ/RimL family protein N-acetyltransferase
VNATVLMRLHVRALFTQDPDGRLVAVNDGGQGTAPRLFIGHTREGSGYWLRRDVGARLAEELRELCDDVPGGLDPVPDAARFVDCLSRDQAVARVWSGPVFECPLELSADGSAVHIATSNTHLLSPWLEDWRVDAALGVPMAASLHDGAAVAVCCSVRVTDDAHEAGVETHPEFRGRGHGSRAVRAWARQVRALRRVPLYSTAWSNEASRALATGLGLVQFGADLHIT